MIQANQEHGENPTRYYYKEEAALLLRIMEYKNNYFASAQAEFFWKNTCIDGRNRIY